jgi:hypothetical protein
VQPPVGNRTDHLLIFKSLVAGFRGRATTDAERSVGAPLNERLAVSVDLAEAGEGGIGLENLCENLHEYDVELTAAAHAQLADLAKRSGIHETIVNTLERLSPTAE